VAIALLLATPCAAQSGDELWNGRTIRQLLSEYSCAWVKEQRKIYSDDELRQKARELHLPAIVVRMAERCPR
jgi:hypothetical protein